MVLRIERFSRALEIGGFWSFEGVLVSGGAVGVAGVAEESWLFWGCWVFGWGRWNITV